MKHLWINCSLFFNVGRFIVYNNTVVDSGEINLNRIFLDDSFILKQNMWYGFGNIPLFTDHVEQVLRQAEMLGFPLPALLANSAELFRLTKRMLNKNRYYRSGLIDMKLIRNEGPTGLLINATSFETFDFPFAEKGIFLRFAHHRKYSQAEPAAYVFYNEPVWKVVNAELKGPLSDNAIILNEQGFVTECIRSNIYMIKNQTLFTPSAQTGCYEDVLKRYIMQSARQIHLDVVESSGISRDEVFQMNEIFLAGDAIGFIKVTGIENKRYVQHIIPELYREVNQLLKDKASVH